MPINQTISSHKGLFNLLSNQEDYSLGDRVQKLDQFLSTLKSAEHYSYLRPIMSPAGRTVIIQDPYSYKDKEMLMFASNNYLGLANHPYIKKKVRESVNKYGVGMAGPPLLNGYSALMQSLEDKISDFKGTESTLIFPAGFMANVGVVGALAQKKDIVIYDKLSHASLYSGLQLSQATQARFAHNNCDAMENLILSRKDTHTNVFVSMEGVYSMDGDTAPLDKMIPICKKNNAFSLLDDAHGIGVLGKNGRGTAELMGVEDQVDIHIGTFSKVFSVTGGYLSGDREVIDYLRYFARPYVFSAALPPMVLAAVSAGIDVIQNEPERRYRLLDNARYAYERLKKYGVVIEPEAAIIALEKPKNLDIRKANRMLHEQGIFINVVEYPAIGINKERFRISICSEHTRSDIRILEECIDKVWNDPLCRIT